MLKHRTLEGVLGRFTFRNGSASSKKIPIQSADESADLFKHPCHKILLKATLNTVILHETLSWSQSTIDFLHTQNHLTQQCQKKLVPTVKCSLSDMFTIIMKRNHSLPTELSPTDVCWQIFPCKDKKTKNHWCWPKRTNRAASIPISLHQRLLPSPRPRETPPWRNFGKHHALQRDSNPPLSSIPLGNTRKSKRNSNNKESRERYVGAY